MKRSYMAFLALTALAFLIAGARPALAVSVGEVIGASNANEVQNLVSPGTFYSVKHDMRMNIVATSRIDWPPPYKDATEKYSGQVRMGGDHRSLIGYVAGQPFPLIDPNDTDVAAKIMWNNAFRPGATDDYDLRFFDCTSQYENKNGSGGSIIYGQVGHYSGYNLVGRTEVDPMPVD